MGDSETIWQLTEDKRTGKYRLLTGYGKDKTPSSETYREISKAVEKSVRTDKRSYTNDLAHKAQPATERGDSRTVYQITQTPTGGLTDKTPVVKHRNGKALTNENRSCQQVGSTLQRNN